MVFAGPGRVLPIAAGAIAVLMLSLWVLSLRLRDVSIVDVAWGPAFVIVALVAALAGGGSRGERWLLLGLTTVWGLRLGAHLAARKLREPGEDRRYTRMRKRRPDFARWSLVWIFGLQGLLVLAISMPIQVAATRKADLGWAVLPGLLVYTLGLGFEAVGDEQLRRFRREPRNRDQVMNRGLWRYTRHPNYFGDTCVWWGLWLVALPAGGTWWTAFGPAIMTLLLVRVSGKPLLERDMSMRRPAYAEYIKRTSGFLPLPPR